MNNAILLAIIITSASSSTRAQEPGIDLEARQRSIPIIEARVAARNAEVMEIGNDILQLHKRIDEKLGRMVDRLAAVKDSVSSRERVADAKMEIIDGLQKAVEGFKANRAALSRKLLEGKSPIPNKSLENELHHFDSHVDMHIKQMLKLSKSFTQDKDVERYTRTGGGSGFYGYDYGWSNDVIEINDEWRQNRRDRAMDKKQSDDVVAALNKSIARCESRIAELSKDLEDASLTEIDRKVTQSELAAHTSMLERRRMQVEGLLVVPKPDTEAVSRDVGDDLKDAVRDLLDDVQRDLQTISNKHRELNQEQENVARLTANLAARKKWLEEYQNKTGE